MEPTTPKQLFTVGHSNESLDQFLSLLGRHQIQVLADIRRFPGSRKFPHFNQNSLAASLNEEGIEYQWFESLGGRRQSKVEASPNHGLQNKSFRNYADYMLTEEFRLGVHQLLEIAAHKRTAMMCAEAVFWRCHRRLVSDYLLAMEVSVDHIMPNGELRPHTLTTGGVIHNHQVTYPGQKILFSQ